MSRSPHEQRNLVLIFLSGVVLAALLLFVLEHDRNLPMPEGMPSKDTAAEDESNEHTNDTDETCVGIKDLFCLETPTEGASVGTTVAVSGSARGYWFFEASAPVSIVNWDGVILGEGYITAEGNWMTEDFVPFTGEITYRPEEEPYSTSGTIIFRKDNPSGLPENDAAFELPVTLETQ
ncbi:hypothetical protein KC722_00220 [Candidatus Kaiserbacteria bacterium]|nr:hypothetical protein [Candidatus Kaiserbacteria bacterium]MCB9811318.1 hypothetical protein [Candidatus Nomurabacteria bacterium]